ncbi:MAG: ribosome maturation factor RimM [bacterium]
MTEDQVVVASVVKPHGVKGELVLEIHTDFVEERFAPGKELKLRGAENLNTLVVESARPHKNRLLLKADGIDSREAASRMRGVDLVIDSSEITELPEGEYYAFQLPGLEVQNQNGEVIGVLREVHDRGARPVFEIETTDGKILDFPGAQELIDKIDLDEEFIRLRFPAGWKSLLR